MSIYRKDEAPAFAFPQILKTLRAKDAFCASKIGFGTHT
jgi:hypothetical protein